VGTSPDIEAFPLIPYEYFTDKHIFDLIYNPAEQFLKGKEKGAQIKTAMRCSFSRPKSVEDLE
jgi:shikimate dehydrogenase